MPATTTATLKGDTRYDALLSRDPRYDGVFFVGVTTTGVYCRPVCPARTPRPDRCRFFRSAVEAERAGFRACFRCRPELAPGAAPVDAVSRLVVSALARVESGFLNDHSVAELAAELGITDRHLRRAVEDEVGVPLVEIAQSRRLAMARQLVMDTALPITRIALASGFRSVRRFNALFAARYGRPPTALKPRRAGRSNRTANGAPARRSPAPSGDVVVRLHFRPPLLWHELLSFLRGRAIPGVEAVSRDEYQRTFRVGTGGSGGDTAGIVRVTLDERRNALRAAVSPALVGQLMHVVARLRVLFDLDARPDVIVARLGDDPLIGAAVRAAPGLRLPGAFDPFEATVRAVLGQQVSVRAATTLAGRLVARFGTPLDQAGGAGRDADDDGAGDGDAPAIAGERSLTHLFPRAGEVAARSIDELASIGLPGARAATLREVAALFTRPELARDWEAGDREEVARRLKAIRGIGDWTAEYVAMRGLHDPDAFPSGDLGVRRALADVSPREAEARAETWRPWRSYAVMHLWCSLANRPSTNATRSTTVEGVVTT
jgi:AraC family transcriptional regulator of adaptative response / DNA-3-methyladenine glycosylase II